MKSYALHLTSRDGHTSIQVDLLPEELALVTCLAEQFEEEHEWLLHGPMMEIEEL